ncbi:hypothetical protein CY34DRAFT_579499 [Suillus luteus UH-Slu-Lm8-n1]|uniref:Unplaced genomic scaffold CY34scaffold_5, whole genome shotgun sequence n=1 Tax=Suillus luteus UH-Slu-Lm8-n1 TaxID=930992 RepID=A0A0D0C1C6_9AGAM|nr:hypothetical protein CY34DRAFT_579499 [Suillus luteus UH-Slu-Lm8-n1]
MGARNQRDGLGNLFGGNDATTSGTTRPSPSQTGSNDNPLGGIASVFSSMFVGGETATPTSPSSSPTTGQISSSGSTSIPSTSTPSTTSMSVSTPNSTPNSTPIPTPTPTPTLTAIPTSASSASLTVLTSTSGTNIIYVTSTLTSSASAIAAAPQSFLQNKPLEGGVFAIVGIVIMVIIFAIVTYAIRRRQRNRLESDIADAITFDPAVNEHYGDEEKGTNTFQKYRLSGSSSGHDHGFGYCPQLAYAPPAVPQYGYSGSQGYEQQAAAYHVPPTQGPIYNLDSAVNTGVAINTVGAASTGGSVDTGGANLTRKYSNRKPVPPLLPNPVYDPSQSPVLPSHYYMQTQDTPISPISQSMSLPAPPGDLATSALPDDSEDDPYTGMLKVVNH